ncbi:hypothetical protein SAMN05421504_103465 [Amycolatopsis xylanica]|uniref:ATP synthase protein I n=1 Tax=Amycolatopsis xylanica TaxID=589385 RepID=A0A1H3DPB9_9PSEU|nr:hypothetical protein [Amycolatopsis xylanica]SDX68197.1 hypothetical protein SAMN05421504_103465 [Amycolatopsis xylanica]
MSESAETEQPNPHAEAMLKLASAMLKATLIVVPPVAVIAVVVSLLVADQPGLIGSGIGVVLGFASSMTTLGMMRFSANLPPMFVMVVALGGYVLKLMVLFGVSFALRGIDGLSANAFAFSMLAVVVVAAAAEVRAFKTTKIPTIIPAS